MNKSFGAKAMIGIAIIASVLFAAPTIGRFAPSHAIEQPVYCGSCHPEQVDEFKGTTHLEAFANDIQTMVQNNNGSLSQAEAISDGCTMCHNFWDNMKWFGVANLTVKPYATDNPSPITDIYGNTVSPYGLSSTYSYNFNITTITVNGSAAAGDNNALVATPWYGGLDSYEYTNATTHTKYDRLDYVWSELSSLSPGHVGYTFVNANNAADTASCGNAEKGMCHIAKSAIVQSELGNRAEILTNTTTGATPIVGSGVFFRHEMAYTTAQYAAKPVKLCGACHVMKLPPMVWGGEPWSQKVVQEASANGGVPQKLNRADDPFGFTPNYPMTGFEQIGGGENSLFNVTYKTPDWAHQNVPCIRCHVHAGINGETVSNT